MGRIYQLNLNKKQLDVVQESLEFFSRFCAGQWRIPDSMEFKEYENANKDSGFWEIRNAVEDSFRALKSELTGMRLNEFYGIGSDKLCESAKIAYDLYRPVLELRSKEYKEANPDKDSWNVYSSPGLSYSKEGRIEIKVIENETT